MTEKEKTAFRPEGARKDGAAQLSHVEDLYQSWFLEYASYVILDRAVPDIRDGLKPVQRRLLHALFELDDGRLNKAANVIGHTMRYHPHGDMAIEDALVKLAQKELLIDVQGNWGNIFTGDRAAAPRYIECRLGKFSQEVLFREELTEWQSSYDGRNREPVVLPVKFPLLLALGVEGIAVGLATKIMPHNVGEICDAAIAHLAGKPWQLFPDFASGGIADFSEYREGQRGGRVRVRARVEIIDAKTLQIKELPFGNHTGSLIESILSAHEKGKIKVKRVEDNTGKEVDIRIYLPQGVSAEQTLEALYAFTDCEISIATHACVIKEQKPLFCTTRELLVDSADRTRELLRQELQFEQDKIEQKIRKASLERIFIEQKLYKKLENAESWEFACEALHKAFKPHLKDLRWTLTDQDLEALLEIRFKRLTRYDSAQADAQLTRLQEELSVVKARLENLTKYAIDHFRSIKQRFGKGKRRTTIAVFGDIKAREVVLANQKLYVNREEGFLGTSLKKDEFVTDCSDLDEVFVLRRYGQASLVKVSDKCFVGEEISYLSLLPASGADSYLHLLYRDKESKSLWAKRMRLGNMQKDKVYELLKQGGEIIYARLQGEAKADWLSFDRGAALSPWFVNFTQMPAQARGHRGQKLSDGALTNFYSLGEQGPERTELALHYDPKRYLLGPQVKGRSLAKLAGHELIYMVTESGQFRIGLAGDQTKLSGPMFSWGRFEPDQVYTAIYGRDPQGPYWVRRWRGEDLAMGADVLIAGSDGRDRLLWFSHSEKPLLQLTYAGEGGQTVEPPPEIFSIGDAAPIRGVSGNAWRFPRLSVKNWEAVVPSKEELVP